MMSKDKGGDELKGATWKKPEPATVTLGEVSAFEKEKTAMQKKYKDFFDSYSGQTNSDQTKKYLQLLMDLKPAEREQDIGQYEEVILLKITENLKGRFTTSVMKELRDTKQRVPHHKYKLRQPEEPSLSLKKEDGATTHLSAHQLRVKEAIENSPSASSPFYPEFAGYEREGSSAAKALEHLGYSRADSSGGFFSKRSALSKLGSSKESLLSLDGSEDSQSPGRSVTPSRFFSGVAAMFNSPKNKTAAHTSKVPTNEEETGVGQEHLGSPKKVALPKGVVGEHSQKHLERESSSKGGHVL